MWEDIKKDYENGLSLRTLDTKYGVSKSSIQRHAEAENWQRGTSPTTVPFAVPDVPAENETHVAQVARSMVHQLATIAQSTLDLKEHKLFADALSQYNKVLITSPEQPASTGIDYSIFTQEELDVIMPLFARAEQRVRDQAGSNNVEPVRKV
jgi:hypothetical protein